MSVIVYPCFASYYVCTLFTSIIVSAIFSNTEKFIIS